MLHPIKDFKVTILKFENRTGSQNVKNQIKSVYSFEILFTEF